MSEPQPLAPPEEAAADLAQSRATRLALEKSLKSARDIMRRDKGLNGELDRLPMLAWLLLLKLLDDMEAVQEDRAVLSGEPYTPVIAAPYRWRDWVHDSGLTGEDLLAFVGDTTTAFPDSSRRPGLLAALRGLRGSDRAQVVALVFADVSNRMRNGFLLRELVDVVDQMALSSSASLDTLGTLYESMLRELRDAAGDSGEFYTPRPVVRFMVQATDLKIGEQVLDPAAGTGGFLLESYLHLEAQTRSVADRQWLQSDGVQGQEAKSLPYLLCQMNLLLHGLDSPNITYGNSLTRPLREYGPADRVDVIVTNPPFGGEEERSVRSGYPPDLQTAETTLLFLQVIMRRLRQSEKPGRAAVVVPNTTLFYTGVAARLRRKLVSEYGVRAIVRLPKGVFEPYTDIETNILFFDAGAPAEQVLYYRLRPPGGRAAYTKTQPLRDEELSEALDCVRRLSDDSPHAWLVPSNELLADPNCILDQHNPKDVRSTAEAPEVVLGKLQHTLGEVTGRMGRADQHLLELDAALAEQDSWPSFRLGDVLHRRRDVVLIEDDVVYRRLRVQVKGRGVLLRDQALGATIGTKRQFEVQEGQFLVSKIDARNGAFGVIPPEGDAAIITGNFWAYDVDEARVDARLLQLFTASDAFIDFCRRASPGATNRRYLQEPAFLEQTVRMPAELRQQQAVAQQLLHLRALSNSQREDARLLSERFPVLLQSALHSVFGGEGRDLEEDDAEAVEDLVAAG